METSLAISPVAAPIVARPALAKWMFERALKPKDAEAALKVGREQIRRYCLPFDDDQRVVPPASVMRRIVAWTQGAVQPGDFYHLTAPGAEAAP